MKKVVILLFGLLIFTGAYAQNKIKAASTYSSEDTISVLISELNDLIYNSMLVCCKVDTLDDGAMIKTIEFVSKDTRFKFIGGYIESNTYFPNTTKKNSLHFFIKLFSKHHKKEQLTCDFALIDSGILYESYELDPQGRWHFEYMLNNTKLYCPDPYE
jgi:hypothetical protein